MQVDTHTIYGQQERDEEQKSNDPIQNADVDSEDANEGSVVIDSVCDSPAEAVGSEGLRHISDESTNRLLAEMVSVQKPATCGPKLLLQQNVESGTPINADSLPQTSIPFITRNDLVDEPSSSVNSSVTGPVPCKVVAEVGVSSTTCPFRGCTSAQFKFRGYSEWLKHHEESHSDVPAWYCPFGECKRGEKGYRQFVKKHMWKMHIKLMHFDADYVDFQLLIAAELGDVNAVRHHLSCGGHLEAVSVRGDKPIHLASGKGHHEVVELLINTGADVNATNVYGMMPLRTACSHGRTEVVKTLLAAGADLHGARPSLTEAESLLHVAVSTASSAIISVLLDANAVIDSRDSNGRTPLLRAAERNSRECMEVLINRGANYHAKDSIGRTALMIAVIQGFSAVLDLLLSHKAFINERDIRGWTALHYAVDRMCFRGSATDDLPMLKERMYKPAVDMAYTLVRAGASVHIGDDEGETPLTMLERYGRPVAAEALSAVHDLCCSGS